MVNPEEVVIYVDNGLELTARDIAIMIDIVGCISEEGFEKLIEHLDDEPRMDYLAAFYKAHVIAKLAEDELP